MPEAQNSPLETQYAKPMTQPLPLQRWSDLPLEALSSTLERRYISTETMTLAQIFLKKGCVVPLHQHENEQIAYILEGKLRFWLGANDEQCFDVGAGEVLVIPPNVPHRAEALEDTLDLDVFSPPRADWASGDDAYLRGK